VSSLVYLGIALVISILGCLGLWLRNRRPRSMDHSIREFSRELDALAPSDGLPPERPPRPRGRRAG